MVWTHGCICTYIHVTWCVYIDEWVAYIYMKDTRSPTDTAEDRDEIISVSHLLSIVDLQTDNNLHPWRFPIKTLLICYVFTTSNAVQYRPDVGYRTLLSCTLYTVKCTLYTVNCSLSPSLYFSTSDSLSGVIGDGRGSGSVSPLMPLSTSPSWGIGGTGILGGRGGPDEVIVFCSSIINCFFTSSGSSSW